MSNEASHSWWWWCSSGKYNIVLIIKVDLSYLCKVIVKIKVSYHCHNIYNKTFGGKTITKLDMIVPISTLLREDAKCASRPSPPLLPPITHIVWLSSKAILQQYLALVSELTILEWFVYRIYSIWKKQDSYKCLGPNKHRGSAL